MAVTKTLKLWCISIGDFGRPGALLTSSNIVKGNCFVYLENLLFSVATLCHKGDVICVSEVIDISPGNLDSSLCFIKPGIFLMIYCAYELNKQGDNMQP